MTNYIKTPKIGEWQKLYSFKHIGSRYTLWRSLDDNSHLFYNITKGNKPPKGDGGYYSIDGLMRLKFNKYYGDGYSYA